MAESSPQDDNADLDVTTPEPSAGETKDTPVEKVAESTPAEKPEGSMLDAVKAAIEPKVDPPATPEKDAPADADVPIVPDAKAKGEEVFTPEEFAQLSQKTQTRLKRLNSESKLQRAEIDRLAPKAKEFDAIDGFVRGAGLTNAEVSGTLEIAAMIRSDPRGALDRLMPMVRRLEKTLGEQIPPELQQRVDAGYLTADDAMALSRADAKAVLANQRADQVHTQQRIDTAVTEQKAATDRTLKSVDVWEKAKLTSDPDFHLKRKEVAELVELAILQEANRQGKPYFPNQEDAVKMSEKALEAVTKRYAQFTPKPTEIKPASGAASPRSTPEPKSFMDAVRQAAAI